ncbi:hypothetical protein DFP72DRAFT_1081836 [Ephemerocybe angulata]|uniref:Uncharacterized protein n=1 Tax=Ephemerocybe angulata TaxID=980116 RepID=A0A8H6LVQ6_9AGAR|nr:hypothetical protein DFP72DRAFT_1081836 [Tulosesus angulatus]
MAGSPRKKTTKSLSPTKSRQRAPQRCRKCPGRPLRSECAHSRAGREKLALDDRHDTEESEEPQNAIPAPPPYEAPQPDPDTDHIMANDSDGAQVEIPIDPVLLAESFSTPEPPENPSTPSTPVPSQASSVSSSPQVPSRRTRRARASNVNPLYDVVRGVGRGSEELRMARVRPIKAPIRNQKAAVKYYDYAVKDLMCRAESIANATGCWLYVAMQHPSSRTPFTHYASRKLRREAEADLGSIHSDMNRMMSQLKRADREQFLDFVRSQERAQESVREANARAEQAASEAERLKGELAAREALLNVIINAARQSTA